MVSLPTFSDPCRQHTQQARQEVRSGGKQRVPLTSPDGSSSSAALISDPPGDEIDIDDGLDDAQEHEAPAERTDALDAQLAAELFAQLNNLRPRRK